MFLVYFQALLYYLKSGRESLKVFRPPRRALYEDSHGSKRWERHESGNLVQEPDEVEDARNRRTPQIVVQFRDVDRHHSR